MANVNDVSKAVEKVEQTQSLQQLIEKSAKELRKALPAHMRPERLVRIALTCIRTNPELSKCTPASFLGSLFVAAQIGIEPVAGRGYILPFNNSRKVNGNWIVTKEAQFLLGYKGLAELFYRHEKSVMLEWGVVHANDEFEYAYGTSAYLKHRPSMQNRGEPIGYYVIATLQSGGKPFMYMSRQECLDHGQKHSKTFDRKTSQFYSASPWATNFDSMALKTCLIQLAKLLPLSVELQRAIAVDETSRDYREGIDDVLDLPETTDWQAPIDVKKEPEPEPENNQTPKNPPATEKGQSKLTDLVKARFAQFQAELGNGRFLELLGGAGYESVDDLTPEHAAKLLTEMREELNDKKRSK